MKKQNYAGEKDSEAAQQDIKDDLASLFTAWFGLNLVAH
jgi:hypothetical protein